MPVQAQLLPRGGRCRVLRHAAPRLRHLRTVPLINNVYGPVNCGD
jgi:hypothetical protein